MPYHLSYYNDTLGAGASLTFPQGNIHRVLYLHQGTAEIDGQRVAEDEAVYRSAECTVTAGAGGVRLFRWELSAHEGKVPANIESMLRMTRECWMIDFRDGGDWLFRLDSIIQPASDFADCHTHPGPGIRSLLSGAFVVQQTSENGGGRYPGDPWWETGPEAVIATPVGDKNVHFLRGMLLPLEFKGRPDTAKWLRTKPKQKATWKLYIDQEIKI